MPIRILASLRYRHWLVASAILFALGVVGLLDAIAGAGGEHLTAFETTCTIAALAAVVINLRIIPSVPDAPRIRTRRVETRAIAGPLFPQRRCAQRHVEQDWQPTAWSPDDLTERPPERDSGQGRP
jgi:hypothetical protein